MLWEYVRTVIMLLGKGQLLQRGCQALAYPSIPLQNAAYPAMFMDG